MNFLTVCFPKNQDNDTSITLNLQNQLFQMLQYNNLGIIHHFIKKPKLAVYYLHKVINIFIRSFIFLILLGFKYYK